MSVTPATVLTAAERKQLLRDPENWLQSRGMPCPDALPALSAALARQRADLIQLSEQSRKLSRAIGEAKKAGTSAAQLLQQKSELSARERELEALIVEAEAGLIDCCVPPSSSPLAEAVSAISATTEQAPDASLGQIDVSTLKAADCDAWDDFVRGHSGASVYHLSGWQPVIADAFGHRTQYLLARAAGAVVGVLPLVQLNSRLFGNFLVSVPFFNYGGALANHPQVYSALLERAQVLARELGCSHMELRDRAPIAGLPARTDKVAMWLTLPGSAAELWQQVGSKVRAQIKKAQSCGITFRIGGIELLDDFYRVFAENMRDLGTPVYSREFFEIILRKGPGEPVLVVGSDARGRPVSVAFLLRFGKRMEVPWASTLRRVNALNANMLLYWQILEYTCGQGCDTFDFGRSTADAPTYRFKKQWGAQPVQLYWHYWLADGGELPRLNPDNPKYRLAIAVWRRLPVWLTRWIGPPIVKNLP